MATPKRKILIRDGEATKRALLEAVGAILREKGFAALKTNVIARWIGKDKNLIRYHFLGLANLQRAYIKEKDYWLPFFERFQLPSSADDGQVKEMFIQLMQQNLKFFYEDAEMQKIILWQISDDNPLMRSISEAREAEGEKLLGLTDRAFEGSPVNFRAVIGLLLGGIYYMVLHAKTNGSKVCGVDVNLERDREEVSVAIGQMITWAFGSLGNTNTEKLTSTSIKTMNYEFEYLETLTSQLCQEKSSTFSPHMPDIMLQNERRRLERVMLGQILTLTSETQIITFLQVNLHKLTEICDRLYRPDVEHNPDAEVILELMEALRKPVAEYIPGNMALPVLFRRKESKKFSAVWKCLGTKLEKLSVDPVLVEITALPFLRFAGSTSRMMWQDFKYLKVYALVLGQLLDDGLTAEDLVSALIGLGFNHARFTAYYSSGLKQKIAGKSALEVRTVLHREKTALRQTTVYTHLSFDPLKQNVTDELVSWIDAEQSCHLEDKMDLPENPFKLNTKLKVLQLAYWQKLQYDHGIYEEVNLEVLSEKIAFNFSSKGQDALSAPSIKSKFYPKDRSVILPIEETLVKMLDDVRQFLR